MKKIGCTSYIPYEMGNTKYKSVDILVLFTFGISSSSVDNMNGGKDGRGEGAGTAEEGIYPWSKVIWEEEGWMYMRQSQKLLSERRGYTLVMSLAHPYAHMLPIFTFLTFPICNLPSSFVLLLNPITSFSYHFVSFLFNWTFSKHS